MLNSYRFGFNGKENDNEVEGEGNWQDYGMRMYSPRLGRFPSVDPIAKKYPMLTPYQFASNTPIEAVDLDGLEGIMLGGPWWAVTPEIGLISEDDIIIRPSIEESLGKATKAGIEVQEPTPSPSGTPKPWNPELTSKQNFEGWKNVGRLGHEAVEKLTDFAKRFQNINRTLPGSKLRPDGWSIDHIDKVIRIGEIKSLTRSGILKGIEQIGEYVSELQKNPAFKDYEIKTELWNYYSSLPIIYKVKSGDNLTKLAKAFNTTVGALTKSNQLNAKGDIKVGQKLNVGTIKQASEQ